MTSIPDALARGSSDMTISCWGDEIANLRRSTQMVSKRKETSPPRL